MNISDIPKLYTALAEWLSCVVFVLVLDRRYTRGKTLGILAAFLLMLVVFQHYIGVWPVTFWLPAMAVAMCLMVLCIWLCCSISISEAVLCFSMAFMIAEFVAAFEWQIYFWLKEMGYVSTKFQLLFLVLFYGTLFTITNLLERKYFSGIEKMSISWKEAITSALMTLAVFLISNISYVYPNTPFSSDLRGSMFYIRTLVDFSGLLVLFIQQDRWREMNFRKEMDAMNSILYRQYEQYQLSKENIEVLNRKYHDLKHQITAIRAERDIEKREQYLEEMEMGIKMYEAQNKTGNTVLDTILTGKQLYCVQHDINFTCVADGELLAFMNVMDLCTIFGNALDNAIESEEKLKDTTKRLIRCAVYSQNQFIMIRFENYCGLDKMKMDLLPLTTKKDKEYHGYGLKSIRSTVEKYGGTMALLVEEGWFRLSLLIPLECKGKINNKYFLKM